jgi:hypothetical protein
MYIFHLLSHLIRHLQPFGLSLQAFGHLLASAYGCPVLFLKIWCAPLIHMKSINGLMSAIYLLECFLIFHYALVVQGAGSFCCTKLISCPLLATASHLPWNRNGLKFFTNEGGLGKSNISDILTRAAKIFSENPLISIGMKEARKINYMEQYTADLVNAVRRGAGGKERPLEGFHIVVDAGNGAGGFFAVCSSCLTPILPPPKTHLQCISTAQSDLFTTYIVCFLLLLQLFMFA